MYRLNKHLAVWIEQIWLSLTDKYYVYRAIQNINKRWTNEKKKEIFVYVSNKYWNQVGMNMLVENYSLLLC